MAIIYSYPEKTTPAGGDFLVITDSEQPAPNKNRTKSLTIDNLASYVTTSTSGITGSGTLNTIAMFTPNGQAIGDSIITQNALGQAITITGDVSITEDTTLSNGNALRWTSGDVRIEGTTAGDNIKFYVANTEILKLAQSGTLATITGNLNVTGSIETSSSLTVQSLSTFNGNVLVDGDYLEIQCPIKDSSANLPSSAGQILVGDAGGNVTWTDSTDIVSGAVAKLIPFQITALAGGSSTYSANNNIVEFSWDNVNGNGTYVLTIPSAATIPYRNIRFVTNSTFPNGASDKVEITAQSGETIDGAAFFEISKQYEGVSLWSNGTEWIVIQAKAH